MAHLLCDYRQGTHTVSLSLGFITYRMRLITPPLGEVLHGLDTKRMKCLMGSSQALRPWPVSRVRFPRKPEVEVCVQVVYGECSGCHTDELAGTQGWAEGEIELPCSCNTRCQPQRAGVARPCIPASAGPLTWAALREGVALGGWLPLAKGEAQGQAQL